MKFKWGKMKRVKTESKKFKMYTGELTITDLPRTLNIHIAWTHSDTYSREEISPGSSWVDDFRNIDLEDYLFYRVLMLEAGFVPVYFWKQEIPHPLTYMKPPKFNPKGFHRI